MPRPELVRLDPENVEELGIHCVESRRHHGRNAKVRWYREHYGEGVRILMFRDPEAGKSAGFIEYAPAERAWRAVAAPGYLVIHCIWVKTGGRGLGSRLITEVVRDAEAAGRAGVAVVTSAATWCADSRIFERNGFETIDVREPFSLLAHKLQSAAADPEFSHRTASDEGATPNAPAGLTLRHSGQCPFVAKAAVELPAEAEARGVALDLVELATARDARDSPTPYGVIALTRGDRVLADHAISRTRFRNILRGEGLAD